RRGAWGWPASGAGVGVRTAAGILGSVRSWAVMVVGVGAVGVGGAATIRRLGDWEGVEMLMDHLPRDAQRVVVSAAFPDEVRDLIDRRVKRALTYPAESVIVEERNVPVTGHVGFVLAREAEKLDILARQLAHAREEEGHPPPV